MMARKCLKALLPLLLLLLASSPAYADEPLHFWDGTADTAWYTEAEAGQTVFHLSTPEQLHGLADITNGIAVVNGTDTAIPVDDFTGKTIYLDQDLYLNDRPSTAENEAALSWEPLSWAYYVDRQLCTPFNGTLDGQGHTIYNIYMHETGVYNDGDFKSRGVALVGYSAEAALIKNITITGYLYGNRYVGGIVGKVGTKGGGYSAAVGPGTTVENCVNYCTVTSTGFRGSGGVVGAGWNCVTVRDCANYGTITALGTDKQGTVGGVVGESEGLVENCANYGVVKNITTTVKANSGGVVGNAESAACVTRNCYNLGAVTGGTAGGIIGYDQGLSYNGYSLGTVTGAVNEGGAIGQIADASYVHANFYYLADTASALVGSGALNGAGGTFSSATSKIALLGWVNGADTAQAGTAFVADTDFINYGYPILRWQSGETDISGQISFVTNEAYNGAPDGYQLMLVTAEPGGGYAYAGSPLWWSEKYAAYAGFVPTAQTAAGAAALLTTTTEAAPAVSYDGDTNLDSQLLIDDVQLAYDLGCYPDYVADSTFALVGPGPRLASDVNFDRVVDVTDARLILALLLNTVV